jgi:hypothetical protein
MKDPRIHPGYLQALAEIEQLSAKIYFRFSHLFLHDSELRDFWWDMAVEQERRKSRLIAIESLSEGFMAEFGRSVRRDQTQQLKVRLQAYLGRGVSTITLEEAVRIMFAIETSKVALLSGARFSEIMSVGFTQAMQNREAASLRLRTSSRSVEFNNLGRGLRERVERAEMEACLDLKKGLVQ